jgi:hypothetical protein
MFSLQGHRPRRAAPAIPPLLMPFGLMPGPDSVSRPGVTLGVVAQVGHAGLR